MTKQEQNIRLWLIKLGITPDGKWGPATERAYQAYMSRNSMATNYSPWASYTKLRIAKTTDTKSKKDPRDKEGPRRGGWGQAWASTKSWVSHPIDHITSATASGSYIPTLKAGDTYKNAIIVRKSNHNLYYYDANGNLAFQSRVATGKNSGLKQAEGDSRTPTGKFTIAGYERSKDPNKFGYSRFLRLNTGKWQGIGIHGDANQPEAIGTNASHGCVRMPNGELVKLTDLIGNLAGGMQVYILDENDQYKKGGRLVSKFLDSGKVVQLPEVTVTATKTSHAPSVEGKKFIQSLNDNRSRLMQYYNLSDLEYADLAKFAVNIANLESKMGTSKRYRIKELTPDSVIAAVKAIKNATTGEDTPNTPSRGMTQIKYGIDIQDPTLAGDYYRLGITGSNMNNPAKSAVATIAHAKWILDELGRENSKHWSDGSVMSLEDLMAMRWNRPKITDYLNPRPETGAGGASGYVRQYRNNKLIK